MSIFDQRMLKPCSDIFYFQLIPTNIVPYDTHNISQNDWPQLITFKLYKGQLLCDQVKKPIPVAIVNQNIIISRVYLNFNVPVKDQEKQVQFTIKIYGVRNKQQQLKQIQGESNKSENQKLSNSRKPQQNLFQIGNCILVSNKYMKEHQTTNTQQFHQTYKINQHFSLQFQLFLAKSRFALERYVKKTKQERRKQDRKQLPNYNELQQFLIHNQNQDKSQVSQNELIHNGETKFISGDKRIMADRKLIVRNHSSVKKTNIIGLQQEKIRREIKSADKSYLNTKIQDKSKIKQTFTKRDNNNQILTQFKEEQTNNSKNLLKIYGCQENKNKNDLPLKITQKTVNQEKRFENTKRNVTTPNKSQKNNSSKAKPEKLFSKSKNPKQQSQELYGREKQQNEGKQKIPTNVNINLGNLLGNKIFLMGFTVFAFILLLNVMSPSKKV